MANKKKIPAFNLLLQKPTIEVSRFSLQEMIWTPTYYPTPMLSEDSEHIQSEERKPNQDTKPASPLDSTVSIAQEIIEKHYREHVEWVNHVMNHFLE